MRRGLQILLSVTGVIAVVAGTIALVSGASSVIGDPTVSPNVDSELRFFAAWYVVAGVLLLWAVPRVEREGRIVLVVAAGFFLAACGRMFSMAAEGEPDRFYIILTIIEFFLAVVIVPWELWVVRESNLGQDG